MSPFAGVTVMVLLSYRYLDLSNNALMGTLSTAMVDDGSYDPFFELYYLDLHNNQLTGTLSDDLLAGWTALTYVVLEWQLRTL